MQLTCHLYSCYWPLLEPYINVWQISLQVSGQVLFIIPVLQQVFQQDLKLAPSINISANKQQLYTIIKLPLITYSSTAVTNVPSQMQGCKSEALRIYLADLFVKGVLIHYFTQWPMDFTKTLFYLKGIDRQFTNVRQSKSLVN